MIREITGTGEGNGPALSIHDGFMGGVAPWAGFLQGADRMTLDSHPYWAFNLPANNDPMPVQMGKVSKGPARRRTQDV